METLHAQSQQLLNEVLKACEKLAIADLETELTKLKSQSSQADFWADNQNAQIVMRRIAELETRVNPWAELRNNLKDLTELSQTGDEALKSDLEAQLMTCQSNIDELKAQLKFSGPYDDHSAIVSIFAGAGGTDAQDWAEMLQRMYTRWSEKQNFRVNLVSQSPGEEAGIKSSTLEIQGPFVYGKLKGEHGVHRLVRLSPYNADNLRQTSFAKVDVLPEIDKPEDIELDDKDLKVDVYRSGGHGGQSVNTTDSAVRVTHIPTGITAAIQNERSQLQNKETAMTILRSRLAQLQLEQHKDKISELKGPNEQVAWGNQIRNYVLHPYKQVKDVRTKHESSSPDSVLDGNFDDFINAYLQQNIS